jgi:hypothetical protein
MKTALVLFGQPRFAELTYNYWYKNLIEIMDCDVFFHTWWSKDMVGTQYPSRARSVLWDEDMLVTEGILDKLVELYKPIDYKYDGYEEFPLFKTNQYQYYTQLAASGIIRRTGNTKTYDCIIRSRFDLAVGQDVEFNVDDNVWVASCCPYTDGRINDMFSISNYENFIKISETFNNLKEFEEQGRGEMEWALYSQIQKENLTIRKFHADYDTFDIVRSTTKEKYVV